MENIDKLITIVEKLENDFSVLDKNNATSVDLMKDRAFMLLPLILVSKNEPKNVSSRLIYEDLEDRVAKIISQF
ncbi:hypothetical protein [Algoriphagus sp. AGSA1]|uniref:hypothetical protein n=1 Tax=Algoriphagus sp. AGSA1 TaxID=2907213 RepID=UPI001F2D8AEE|nr:hypothetical protein [Algoriphagus sp. AGSA1]